MKRETSQAASIADVFRLTACYRPGLFEVPEHHGEHSVQSFKIFLYCLDREVQPPLRRLAAEIPSTRTGGSLLDKLVCCTPVGETRSRHASELGLAWHWLANGPACLHRTSRYKSIGLILLFADLAGARHTLANLLTVRPCSRCHPRPACRFTKEALSTS